MTEASWQDEFARAQATKRANVVCMKWGTRYGPEWVNRLYGMVKRNSTWDLRFVCLTDDGNGIRPEVEVKPLPQVRFDPSLGKYWPKLGLMQKDLGGPERPLEGLTLFLDLDLIVIDSIDPFLTYPGRFLIIKEWKDPQLGYGNSSVVRWFIGRELAVLDRFYATPPDVIRDVYALEGAELSHQGRGRGEVLAIRLVRAVLARLPAPQPHGALLRHAEAAAGRQDPGVLRLDHAGKRHARRARDQEAGWTRLAPQRHPSPVQAGRLDRRCLARIEGDRP